MKLTLNIEPGLIDGIKKITKNKQLSLSKFTENYYKSVIESEKEPFRMKDYDELPDFVKNLKISGGPIPDFDNKAEYHKHLEEKYGH